MIDDPYPDLTLRYQNCLVLPQHEAEVTAVAEKIKANQLRYETVSQATGFPWYLVAAIHNLESSLNFRTYLQNGDHLFNSDGKPIPTVHVPRGVGPFDPQTWENAAIHALGGHDSGEGSHWTIGYCLRIGEWFNGSGYRRRSLPSPYLWSGTDQYHKGKYVADGVFDPDAVSDQIGIAAIFKKLGI